MSLMENKECRIWFGSCIIMSPLEQDNSEEDISKTNDGKNVLNNENLPCDNQDGKKVSKMLHGKL